MNKQSSLKPSGSLLERAADIFDFEAQFRRPTAPAAPVEPSKPDLVEPVADAAEAEVEEAQVLAGEAAVWPAPEAPKRSRQRTARSGSVSLDRDVMRVSGLIEPDSPIGGLAEEFRIIKRQLLLGTSEQGGIEAAKRRIIMVCSATPGEGKSFCAANLALSIAAEKDLEVLLVDGDFPKPELMSLFGVEAEKGLIDAIADPSCDPNSLIIGTDIGNLSLLPAGKRVLDATEMLSSARTSAVLHALTVGHDNRVVIFDSPPALVASPATVLASHAGQVMMVVRADRTTDSDLREALSLLSACENISLMLNGTSLAVSGRRFGSYYGYGNDE